MFRYGILLASNQARFEAWYFVWTQKPTHELDRRRTTVVSLVWGPHVDGHVVQWIPSFLRKTLNSCWPKTYGKKDIEKVWKIMEWSALLPKIKKRTKNIITFHNHLPPFLEDFGGVSTSNVPSYDGWVGNCVRVGQRPYACLTISGSGIRCAANARHYRQLQILFPWWKRSRSVVSSHFRLILSREIMVPGPCIFFFLTNR